MTMNREQYFDAVNDYYTMEYYPHGWMIHINTLGLSEDAVEELQDILTDFMWKGWEYSASVPHTCGVVADFMRFVITQKLKSMS